MNAPPGLREELAPLTTMALIARCAGLHPGPVDTVLAEANHMLRAIARRWHLNEEV